MKTFSAKQHEVQHDWYVVDATDKVLGRVASEVALRLRGKHKPNDSHYTEDFVHCKINPNIHASSTAD